MSPGLNELEGLSDAVLARKLASEVRYHDNLIDSAPMGDERIYYAGKAIDAMRAEQRRRTALGNTEPPGSACEAAPDASDEGPGMNPLAQQERS